MLGYIYGEPAEVQEYASGVRFIFVPIIMLSGLWMYAGVTFAVIGVAVWLGAYYFVGIGTAILSMVALFIARGVWLAVGRRRAK
jgi:thiosulfate reductase cytochrome b subunit